MAGTARRQGCSSVIEHAADRYMRARTRAEAVALCWTTLKLAQVSLPARTCPHPVLLCGLAPCHSSTAQPDPRLYCVGGRWLSDAAFEAAFDRCQAAACSCIMAKRRSSRRPPMCCTAAAPVHGRALFEVRTTAGGRSCCPPPAGRPTGTNHRAGVPLESLGWGVLA